MRLGKSQRVAITIQVGAESMVMLFGFLSHLANTYLIGLVKLADAYRVLMG